jgi:hypothetical protein
MIFRLCAVSLLLLLSAVTYSVEFKSGDKQVQLIELYTSEGCSSCPPADNFLTRFLDDPTLWHSRIPIAIQVDYWYYIGCQDSFASKENSARQRLHAQQGNVSQVYTPGFIVSGEEWRSWFLGDRTIPTSRAKPGELLLSVDDKSFNASFSPIKNVGSKLELHLALLGFGLVNDIDAGENHGRKLAHNFVKLSETVVISRDQSWQGELPDIPKNMQDYKQLAVVAWVSSVKNIKPIQATGGWLEN